MDFAIAYKKCRRAQALKRGVTAVESVLKGYSTEWFVVEEVELRSFNTIPGYKVVTIHGIAFFPKFGHLPPVKSGLTWLRDVFSSADIIVPPYYQLGFLSTAANLIHESSGDTAKIEAGSKILHSIYTPQDMAQLIVGAWSQRKTFSPYLDQIIEATKAYLIGLHGVAIVGLLPCIEGIVRNLGLSIGIDVGSSVDIRSLLLVFKHLKRAELESILDGYSWFPERELNVEYLDGFHERVQIFSSIELYFKIRLYTHTEKLPATVTLNRHGIAHGFFTGYASAENFLRLFNLISALSLTATMAEGKGSLFHPGDSNESETLQLKLTQYKAAASELG